VDESEIAPRGVSLCECDVEGQACLGLTNDWLRNQTRDRTSQPHEASELLRDAEGKQEGCAVSSVAGVRIMPEIEGAKVSLPQLDRPGDLGTCHGYTEVE